ncbi:Mannose-6-phosphate isomerase [Auxenochlorella protothecoides]|uniref:mannose-6-phosphate isomerase n=1 Tax=Auxenochlorella protothecoides TaxID=3075 RepID=A0A087SGW9_AUXPR|nr:Mannose-6-phosphate isomerase [Auxenochlorella protothecoides]KFM24973.1 Mannose-6-phosphate isomerase [Auxenochlorella protothecoides]
MVTLSVQAPVAPHANGVAHDGLYRLQCKAQTYAWGLPMDESEVARLCLADGQMLDPSLPYAELWMGTHPSAPSTLAAPSGQPLSDLLQRHPELLGAAAPAFGIRGLPFLFKVLSIGSALSIQSHPDKALAARLHAERPDVYPDANHKPEMVLALTRCEALCGFAPAEELAGTLAAVPELRAMEGGAGRHARDALALHLAAQYPRDVGVLAALTLNHVTLEAGEALALPANLPHAYLAGQALEAMAESDNVIRAGLTPKLRDAAVLCASLSYDQARPEVLRGERCGGDVGAGEAKAAGEHGLRRYRPSQPFPEFEVWTGRAAPGTKLRLAPAAGPALLLVRRGEARAGARRLGPGHAFFLAAGRGMDLEVAAGGQDLEIAAAACNGMGFGSGEA